MCEQDERFERMHAFADQLITEKHDCMLRAINAERKAKFYKLLFWWALACLGTPLCVIIVQHSA